jgi:hypothetical protein
MSAVQDLQADIYVRGMKKAAKVIKVRERAEGESSFAKDLLAPLVGMGLTMTRMVDNLTGKVNATIRPYFDCSRRWFASMRGVLYVCDRVPGRLYLHRAS